MANQRVAKLVAPTIGLTGPRLSNDSRKNVTDGTWSVRARVLDSTDPNNTSTKTFSIEDGSIEQSMVFSGYVDLTMTSAGVPMRTRANTFPPSSRPTFYGDLAGVLNDSPQTDAAEIRYTVNGKDPSRTKYYRWGIDSSAEAIRLQMDKTGSSETVIKARTYYRGRWSDATTIRLKIAKSSPSQALTDIKNAGNSERVIADPSKG